MYQKIKNRVEKELNAYISSIDELYSLKRLSPLLYRNIKDFIRRGGKRLRPALFCISYLGYARKTAQGIYRSAIALELLHDFLLVHDDIIDNSLTRRGKPSLHVLFSNYLAKNKDIKFNGEDLALIAGDALYAMALETFLSVKENPRRKELALRKFILAAFCTAGGEFIELLLGTRPIEKVTRSDIYKIYDYKTANYTFSSPLVMGAILAGAGAGEIKNLSDYGLYLGRAFQIKDDIIGLFGKDSETGKSSLTDLNEAKKTILIWYAYNNSKQSARSLIKKIMRLKKTGNKELGEIRGIVIDSGALDYAKGQISRLLDKAQLLLDSLSMREEYRLALDEFSKKTLTVGL